MLNNINIGHSNIIRAKELIKSLSANSIFHFHFFTKVFIFSPPMIGAETLPDRATPDFSSTL